MKWPIPTVVIALILVGGSLLLVKAPQPSHQTQVADAWASMSESEQANLCSAQITAASCRDASSHSNPDGAQCVWETNVKQCGRWGGAWRVHAGSTL